MLFFRGREWGNPSRVSAYVLFMVIIVIGQLSATDKKKKSKYCFCVLKIPGFQSELLFLFFTFQGGGKKKYKVLISLPLRSVYCFEYLLPHFLLVITF